MEVTGIIPYPYFRILQREPSYAIGENVNWYSHYGEHYGGYLKILKIDLPYDPAIPLLGIPDPQLLSPTQVQTRARQSCFRKVVWWSVEGNWGTMRPQASLGSAQVEGKMVEHGARCPQWDRWGHISVVGI